jgi:2'-5' RNA ligase/Mlc titration factor MtfA (ptsG expression regulator)
VQQQAPSQQGGWEAKAERKAAEERKLYTDFYSDPTSAVMWAEQNPAAAQKLAESPTHTVQVMQAADPDLPPLQGRPQDAKVRRQWLNWVREAVANPQQAAIHAEASGPPGPGKWQRVPDGAPVPNHPSIESATTPLGTFARVRPPAGSSAQAQPTDTASVKTQPAPAGVDQQVNAQQVASTGQSAAALPPQTPKRRMGKKTTNTEAAPAVGATQTPAVANANSASELSGALGAMASGVGDSYADKLWSEAQATAANTTRPKATGGLVEQVVDKAARAGMLVNRADFDRLMSGLKEIEGRGGDFGKRAESAAALLNDLAEKASTSTTAAAETKKFSSTQINLPDEIAGRVAKAAKNISAADLAEEGREPEPHVTVKFGLHTDDAEAVRKLIESEPPIRVRIGKSSVFPATEASGQRGGSQHDVVKLDVHSEDLHRLNAKIASALEHTDTHPEYKPHVTLAYVKPGVGQKYVGMTDLEGTETTIDHVVFSGKGGQKVEIPLRGKRRMGRRAAPAEAQTPSATGEDTQQIAPAKKRRDDADGNIADKLSVNDEGGEHKVLGFGAASGKKQPGSKVGSTPDALREISGKAAASAGSMTAAVTEGADQLRSLLAPATRGESAKVTALATREMAAELARRNAIVEAKLKGAGRFFEQRTREQNLAFIDAVETGAELTDPQEAEAAKQLRELLDGRRDEVRALGTGKLEHFIQDYFPHIWTDPKKAGSVMRAIAGKRPLEGSKGFLKNRTLPTTKAGIEAGLEPVSFNPVDLTMLKLRELDRYIMAQRLLNEDLKLKGLAVYVKAHEQPPEGFAKYNDRMFTVYGPPTVTIAEHVDENVLNGLEAVAKELAVKHERLPSAGRRALGFSVQGGNRVVTQNAAPLSVLAHEIGHQIDHLFGMQKVFGLEGKGRGGELAEELRNIADLRFDGKDPSEVTANARAYTRKAAEKMAQVVEAYVHAPERMREVAPRVYKKFDAFLDSHDELRPMRDIKTSLALKRIEFEKAHGGMLIMGSFYGPAEAVKVLNNYLSPGLRETSGLFRGYLGAANVLNQCQLGWSAFHLGFTSVDAATSKLSLAIENTAHGELSHAVKHLGQVPLAPVTNAILGSKVLEEYSKPGSQGGEIAAIVEALVAGGGRAHMDRFYATDIAKNVARMFREGGWKNYLGGVLQAPFAATELAAKPIMEYIVPRQKLGVFADMMRAEMRRRPNMTHDELRDAAAKAWDSTDNRMGQLVYDNLFWHKVTKDLAMASTRSVGWNLGTVRELGGGAVDFAAQGKNLVIAQDVELTHRMAYVVALPIMAGMLGAITQYLFTGLPPDSLKDLFFPRTGEKDAEGRDERVSLPTYIKDLYAYAHAPGQTVENKLHPLLGTLAEMLSNEDFYGTAIRNEDDSWVQQALDVAKHIGESFVPFGVRGAMKLSDEGAPLHKKFLPFVGVTPAPSSIIKSQAEQLAQSLAAEHMPKVTRTKEQAERSMGKRDLVKKIRTEGPAAEDDIEAAIEAGTIKPQDVKELRTRADMSSLEASVKHLPADEAMKVYRLADEAERRKLYWMVQAKIANNESHSLAEKKAMVKELGAPPAGGHEQAKELRDAAAEFAGQILYKLTGPPLKRRLGENLARYHDRLAKHVQDVKEAKQSLGLLTMDRRAMVSALRGAARKRGDQTTSDAFTARLRRLGAQIDSRGAARP